MLFPAALEVGPQPNGVIRADIFNMVKEAVDLTIEWLQQLNSGETQGYLLQKEKRKKHKLFENKEQKKDRDLIKLRGKMVTKLLLLLPRNYESVCF